MARLVVKDSITSGGALAVGQTLRLGGFVMTARSAAVSTMTSWVIESNLHVSSEFAEQLDPMELSSLNELLDRFAALGVATNYDQIGPKQRVVSRLLFLETNLFYGRQKIAGIRNLLRQGKHKSGNRWIQ